MENVAFLYAWVKQILYLLDRASSDDHVNFSKLGSEQSVDLLFCHVPDRLVVDSQDFVFALEEKMLETRKIN